MGALISCIFQRKGKGRKLSPVHLADMERADGALGTGVSSGEEQLDQSYYQSPPRNEVKMLLLGRSESGKSTLVKQLKMLLQTTGRSTFRGFTDPERRCYRRTIYSNAIAGMKAILKGMIKLGVKFEDPARKQDYRLFSVISQRLNEGELSTELAVVMQRLWSDPGVQQCLHRSNEYDLNDSAPYFLNALERVTRSGYLPTDEDILKARVKKFEPTEMTFVQDSFRFRVIDFGDQESDRKKWVQCFSSADAIVFCAALSDYDSIDHDSGSSPRATSKNKLRQAMDYFSSICNNKFFNYTTIFLVLNKTDVFKTKLETVQLSTHFPAFKGENTFDEATAFIRQKFERLNHQQRRVHTFLTCATDIDDVRGVWAQLVNCIRDEAAKEK